MSLGLGLDVNVSDSVALIKIVDLSLRLPIAETRQTWPSPPPTPTPTRWSWRSPTHPSPPRALLPCLGRRRSPSPTSPASTPSRPQPWRFAPTGTGKRAPSRPSDPSEIDSFDPIPWRITLTRIIESSSYFRALLGGRFRSAKIQKTQTLVLLSYQSITSKGAKILWLQRIG